MASRDHSIKNNLGQQLQQLKKSDHDRSVQGHPIVAGRGNAGAGAAAVSEDTASTQPKFSFAQLGNRVGPMMPSSQPSRSFSFSHPSTTAAPKSATRPAAPPPVSTNRSSADKPTPPWQVQANSNATVDLDANAPTLAAATHRGSTTGPSSAPATRPQPKHHGDASRLVRHDSWDDLDDDMWQQMDQDVAASIMLSPEPSRSTGQSSAKQTNVQDLQDRLAALNGRWVQILEGLVRFVEDDDPTESDLLEKAALISEKKALAPRIDELKAQIRSLEKASTADATATNSLGSLSNRQSATRLSVASNSASVSASASTSRFPPPVVASSRASGSRISPPNAEQMSPLASDSGSKSITMLATASARSIENAAHSKPGPSRALQRAPSPAPPLNGMPIPADIDEYYCQDDFIPDEAFCDDWPDVDDPIIHDYQDMDIGVGSSKGTGPLPDASNRPLAIASAASATSNVPSTTPWSTTALVGAATCTRKAAAAAGGPANPTKSFGLSTGDGFQAAHGGTNSASRSFLKPSSAINLDRRPLNNSGAIAEVIEEAEPDQSEDSRIYPWSAEVNWALLKQFGLKQFRHNQLEAINTTLSGKDCFILMPTGGGKSLCYQLPAIVSKGATRGLTVVVSPLLSLMQDQVTHLLTLGIPTAMLNSTLTEAKKSWLFDELYAPELRPKLLYVTPEMLTRSNKFRSALTHLYQRKLVARFVIDEAHCVSQWGHDFRPDYKDLGFLRREYPNIPIMALTATANEKVKIDVQACLQLQNCVTFVQSFNRANLRYEVRPKNRSIDDDIVAFINTFYPGKSGIIYCTSKRSCEETTDRLNNRYGLKAAFYHAGLDKQDRQRIQEEWIMNKVLIIVATVAFGMGIDKSDVRFVIHYSLPQSIEGYYQETGRAGRDGKESTCVLFYSYRDKHVIETLIDRGEGSADQKERQRNNLRQMIAYCDNQVNCRREIVLQYFGERFDKVLCNRTCDNCRNGTTYIMRDVTNAAIDLVKFVQSVRSQRVTLNHVIDVYRGMKRAKIVQMGHTNHEIHGKGKHYSKSDLERILHELTARDVLVENCQRNQQGFVTAYAQVGRNGEALLRHQLNIAVPFMNEDAAPQTTSTTGPAPATNAAPGSWIHKLPTRSKRKTAVASDVDDDDDDETYVESEMAEVRAARTRGTTRGVTTRSTSKRTRSAAGGHVEVSETPPPEPPQIQGIKSKCFDELKRLRNTYVQRLKCKPESIFTDFTLGELSSKLPTGIMEFLSIPSIDDDKFERYGREFLEATKRYARMASEAAKSASDGRGAHSAQLPETSPHFASGAAAEPARSHRRLLLGGPRIQTMRLP